MAAVIELLSGERQIQCVNTLCYLFPLSSTGCAATVFFTRLH